MSTPINSNNSISVCANCGKEGTDVTNTCNKCNSVKYCNAACKKKHRHKHKKDCERRVAELHDEALFKKPPPFDDCPICFLRMPSLTIAQVYMACCGKVICRGCVHAVALRDDDQLCPFCRTPPDTDEEMVKLYKNRMDLNNDPRAMHGIGSFYSNGLYGLPQNYGKALKLYHKAADLGCADGYNNIGIAHDLGHGVEVDTKKAVYYYELAAMGGVVEARHNLGFREMRSGNIDRMIKHWMIAAGDGFKNSVENIQTSYKIGHATKDDYATALRLFQVYLGEIKSDQRDEAAAYDVEYKYY